MPCLLLWCQALALRKSIRVTFMSGDVHVAAAAKFMTHPRGIDLRADHRYMLQVRNDHHYIMCECVLEGHFSYERNRGNW